VTASQQEIYMMRAIKVSLFGNIILFLIKAVALILVNSLAIAVDLGISSVALVISIILYYSIKLANRPEDLFHNYGYSKMEHVCEAIEGIVMIGIALAMSFQAIMNIFYPKHINMPWVGFASSSLNFTINFIGAYYILRMAKKSSSPAIHAEGIHYKLEGFVSMTIAASFLVSIFLRLNKQTAMEPYVDPIATLLVSVMITFPSFNLTKNAFFKLLDSSIEEGGSIEVIKQLAQHSEKYCDFKNLKSRVAGRKKFIELELVMPEDILFKKGHDIVTLLEKDILANIPESIVTIKMTPCNKDCEFIKKNQNCPYL
jgi:cation diffusion facilitator family transporter